MIWAAPRSGHPVALQHAPSGEGEGRKRKEAPNEGGAAAGRGDVGTPCAREEQSPLALARGIEAEWPRCGSGSVRKSPAREGLHRMAV